MSLLCKLGLHRQSKLRMFEGPWFCSRCDPARFAAVRGALDYLRGAPLLTEPAPKEGDQP